MKLYREVKCSDRLPEKEVPKYNLSMTVFVYYKDGGAGISWYDYQQGRWFADEQVVSWLEPYELPTEEEIKQAIGSLLAAHLTLIDVNGRDGSWPEKNIAKRAFNERRQDLTNLLKGER